MSNIEDIKFIEEMIKEYKTFGDLQNPDYEDTDRIYKALENILEEREQDKKRIKKLEEDNLHWRGKYLIALDRINMIPKQKVIDRINYYDERIKHAKQIRDKEQEEFYTDLKRAFNKLLEEK